MDSIKILQIQTLQKLYHRIYVTDILKFLYVNKQFPLHINFIRDIFTEIILI